MPCPSAIAQQMDVAMRPFLNNIVMFATSLQHASDEFPKIFEQQLATICSHYPSESHLDMNMDGNASTSTILANTSELWDINDVRQDDSQLPDYTHAASVPMLNSSDTDRTNSSSGSSKSCNHSSTYDAESDVVVTGVDAPSYASPAIYNIDVPSSSALPNFTESDLPMINGCPLEFTCDFTMPPVFITDFMNTIEGATRNMKQTVPIEPVEVLRQQVAYLNLMLSCANQSYMLLAADKGESARVPLPQIVQDAVAAHLEGERAKEWNARRDALARRAIAQIDIEKELYTKNKEVAEAGAAMVAEIEEYVDWAETGREDSHDRLGQYRDSDTLNEKRLAYRKALRKQRQAMRRAEERVNELARWGLLQM